MSSCSTFRARLERELSGAASATRLEGEEMRALRWHEHLVGCGACRELLEAEQALEAFLASLPEPHLPPALTRRVLARLRIAQRAEDSALDALLDLDAARPSERLAQVLLERLQPERHGVHELALDRLLERDTVVVPDGLAARLLAELAAHRRLRPVRALRRTSRVLPLAAALLALIAGFAWWPREELDSDGLVASVDEPEPELELLEALDVLEDWELLMDDDTDLLFSTYETADELLLEFWETEGDPAEEDPSKG